MRVRFLVPLAILFLPAAAQAAGVGTVQLSQGGVLVGASNGLFVQPGTAFAAAFPSTGIAIGGEYLTSLPTLSSGNMGALQVDQNGRVLISPTNVTIGQASTTSGQSGDLVMGAVTTSAPNYTTAQSDPLSLDTSGNLRVNCTTGCSASTFADEATFTQGTTSFAPIGGIYNTAITNLTAGQAGAVQLTTDRMMYTNLGKVGGTAVSLGSKASSASIPVVIASDQGAVPASQNGTWTVQPGNTANTTPWLVTGSGTAGTPASGVLTVQGITNGTAIPVSGTFWQSTQPVSLASLPALAAGSASIGTVGLNTGSNTVGKIDLLGNAGAAMDTTPGGTAATNALQIQGVASMTPVANNLTQVNGNTALAGAGAVGTGSARVAVGQDTTTIAGSAPGTAGSASANVVTMQGIASMTPVLTTASGAYPSGATAETISATGTTAATAATLAAAVGKTTYICGFSIRANATAAATGNATVAGTITGTLNFTQWTAPLASGLGIAEQIFTPCVPASATNTTIVVTSAAPGSGGTVSVSAWGYQQ